MGKTLFLFQLLFAVQGRKILDIDYPEGPFGTKVSNLHFVTSTKLFFFSIVFLIGEVILYACFFYIIMLCSSFLC